MPDLENVIKGLETCSDVYYGADGACSSCPYSQTNGDRCLAELVHDAITMLKEQPEIVRCKDCAYALFKEGVVEHGHIFCTKPFTERWQAVKPDDWYCADGQYKEGR